MALVSYKEIIRHLLLSQSGLGNGNGGGSFLTVVHQTSLSRNSVHISEMGGRFSIIGLSACAFPFFILIFLSACEPGWERSSLNEILLNRYYRVNGS